MAREERKRGDSEATEETRRTILRVAQQLFMEHGYRSITTRQIADTCGLTQPALYHYFHDKQELYVAMAREELSKTRAALERITRRGENVEERLRRVAFYLLNSTQRDHSQMLHDIRHELTPEARAILNDSFQESMISPITAVFTEGQQNGFLRDAAHGGAHPIMLTYLFLNLISGFISNEYSTLSSFGPEASPIDSQSASVNLVIQALLYGFASLHPS